MNIDLYQIITESQREYNDDSHNTDTKIAFLEMELAARKIQLVLKREEFFKELNKTLKKKI